MIYIATKSKLCYIELIQKISRKNHPTDLELLYGTHAMSTIDPWTISPPIVVLSNHNRNKPLCLFPLLCISDRSYGCSRKHMLIRAGDLYHICIIPFIDVPILPGSSSHCTYDDPVLYHPLQ